MPSEIGMVMTEMSVPRTLPRKKSTTTPVSSTAITSSSTMFAIRNPTNVELSYAMSNLRRGKSSWISASFALTPSITRTELASGCCTTEISTAGLPLNR